MVSRYAPCTAPIPVCAHRGEVGGRGHLWEASEEPQQQRHAMRRHREQGSIALKYARGEGGTGALPGRASSRQSRFDRPHDVRGQSRRCPYTASQRGNRKSCYRWLLKLVFSRRESDSESLRHPSPPEAIGIHGPSTHTVSPSNEQTLPAYHIIYDGAFLLVTS